MMASTTPARTARRFPWTTGILAIFILIPAGLGFGKKFLEFLMLVGDEEGNFAAVPVLNYLLASVGFAFLFFWAMLHGMFRDLEQPKLDMLSNEFRLDAEAEEDRDAWRED